MGCWWNDEHAPINVDMMRQRALAVQLDGNWYRAGQGTRPGPQSQPRSPHLGFFPSAWNQVPIPVFLFSQMSIISTAFVCRGREIGQGHSANPETVPWGFQHKFLSILPNFYTCCTKILRNFVTGALHFARVTQILKVGQLPAHGIWILRSLSSVTWKWLLHLSSFSIVDHVSNLKWNATEL